ncbi:LacI family DNA-binding transcriptional regulator [Miniphocaeibacter halophilus]|uniref:LacI family DNA-binding transcriptional regulator n=1 Tax=Miniphocaeibacter halophilus TaxID=2931922 RepID=A0AC61MNJ3_9FIRM|nr:LacI family DNA-binding transcriptional regulator [Miniphocaeibacter halophilus]QQK07117.1 LacI family DNA-binding transcriptional regulator [Miniphocaeibacter halophilus]
MSSPTIKDVARLAGVSISTVSRVMNDSKPVSPEARRKVLDAIKKLDFKPNELARSLVMRRSNLIGVIVKDIAISYMTEMVRGIEEVGRMYNYDILLSSSYGDIELEKKIINFMFTKQVEGIVLISEDAKPEVVYMLQNQTIPYIQLDKFYNFNETYSVTINYKEAAKEMTEFLIGKGHEKILFVKEYKNAIIGQEKLKGYKEVMDAHNYFSREITVDGVTDKEGYKYGEEIWKIIEHEGITAAFFSEDGLAIGFLNYCYDNNKKVPDDISVAGFGDIKISSLYRPRLTTVREPYYDYGAVAVRKIIKKIKDNVEIDSATILPSSIIERETVKDIN